MTIFLNEISSLTVKFVCSAPALSSRGAAKTSIPVSMDDLPSKTQLKAYTNGELSWNLDSDDRSGSGMAAPLFKSFMQVS